MSIDPNGSSSESRFPEDPAKTKFSAESTRALSSQDAVGDDESSEFDFDAIFSESTGESKPVSGGAQSSQRSGPVLGEYIILDRLGAGGMGHVYRAKHRTMDREVAIKILPKRLSSDPFSVERFYAEVRAQGRLMHPNIVTAFDAGCHRTRNHSIHYLVMELIQGESLSQRIASHGPMTGADALNLLQQAAGALDYAHGLGIIHRDIKPEIGRAHV